MTLASTLFGFKGRMRRRDWWLWTIVSGVTYVAAVWLLGMMVFGADAAFESYPLTDFKRLAVDVASHLPLLWVQCALAAKRAHDRDHGAVVPVVLTLLSGAATYLPGFGVPGGGGEPGSGAMIAMVVLMAASVIASVYLLVLLGFLEGTPGRNRYGPSPKGIGGGGTVETARVFD